MSHRGLGLILSILGVFGLISLVLVIVTEVGAVKADDISTTVTGIYQNRLPLVVSDYVPPKVTIWTIWSGDYLKEYQNIVNEFNVTHPEMAIRLVYVPNLETALSTAIPANTGPDIVLSSNDRIGSWESAGYLVQLDTWIDQDYLDDNFEPAAVKGVNLGDKIWGVPDTQEGIALVYNRDVISDTEIPSANDFAELLTEAKQFQLANPGKYYLCNQGLGNPDAYHAAPIYLGFGLNELGGFVDEYGTVNMTTTEAISAAEWISDFSVNGPVTTTYQICQDMLSSGEAAIWWTGPWALPYLPPDLNYGIAPMESPFVSVRNYMLTTNGVERGNAEAAIYVMKYFGSSEIQKRLTLANKTIPANTVALNDPEVQAIKEVVGFGASVHLGLPMGNHIYTNCQWGPVGDATWAIWSGAQTPVEAMNTAQAAIEACVASISP